MFEEKKVHFGGKADDAGKRLIDLIMLTIKDIDKERNGYVTSAELDDILKLYCPERLGNRELSAILKKFSSI